GARLRSEHPVFEKRYRAYSDWLDFNTGVATRNVMRALLLDGVEKQLQEVVGREGKGAVTKGKIERLLQKSGVIVVLNALLPPRKAFPEPLTKLYWLCVPSDGLEGPVPALTTEYKRGIKALWELLERVAVDEH